MKKITKSGRITWKRFDRDFQLLQNHLNDDASWGGTLFETYGDEVEFVKSMISQNRVMTVYDSDNGRVAVTPGFHLVNRIGYLVTEKPIEYDFWIFQEKW